VQQGQEKGCTRGGDQGKREGAPGLVQQGQGEGAPRGVQQACHSRQQLHDLLLVVSAEAPLLRQVPQVPQVQLHQCLHDLILHFWSLEGPLRSCLSAPSGFTSSLAMETGTLGLGAAGFAADPGCTGGVHWGPLLRWGCGCCCGLGRLCRLGLGWRCWPGIGNRDHQRRGAQRLRAAQGTG